MTEEPPWNKEEFGETLIEKSSSTTARVGVAVKDNPLAVVPVTLKTVLPTGVVLLVVTLRTDDDVAGFWLKVALAPAGNPEAAKVTGPEKPLMGVIETL